MIFIFSTFGEEQEVLAALGRLSHIGMSDFLILFAAEVACEVTMFQRHIAKPEVFLGGYKTPNSKTLVTRLLSRNHK